MCLSHCSKLPLKFLLRGGGSELRWSGFVLYSTSDESLAITAAMRSAVTDTKWWIKWLDGRQCQNQSVSRPVSQSVRLLPLRSQKTHPSSADSWFIYRSQSARFLQENVFICFGATDRSRSRRRCCRRCSSCMQTSWFRSLKRSEPVFSWLPALSFFLFIIPVILFLMWKASEGRINWSASPTFQTPASVIAEGLNERKESQYRIAFTWSHLLSAHSVKSRSWKVFLRASSSFSVSKQRVCFFFFCSLIKQKYSLKGIEYQPGKWWSSNRWRRKLGEVIWGNDNMSWLNWNYWTIVSFKRAWGMYHFSTFKCSYQLSLIWTSRTGTKVFL